MQRWTAIVSGKVSIPRKRALKKGSKRCTGAGIKFNNVVYRDRDQVTHQWKQYFQNLYTPSTSGEFDCDCETHVSNKMNEVHSNVYQTLDALVRPDDINATIGNLPTGKACGFDNIYYEHLIPIRDLVSPVLAYVYIWMLRLQTV